MMDAESRKTIERLTKDLMKEKELRAKAIHRILTLEARMKEFEEKLGIMKEKKIQRWELRKIRR